MWDSAQDTLSQIGTELQLIKARSNLARCRTFEAQVGRPHFQVHIRHHLGELAIQLDLLDAVAEVLTRHTLDFVRVGNKFIERTILGDPLSRGLFAHLRNVGKIVRRVTTQGRKVRILLWSETILFFHCGRGKPVKCRHAAHGIQDGRGLVDKLQIIAITRHEQGLIVRSRLRRQRRHNVIGLEVLTGQRSDAECLQYLADKLHLSAELFGCCLSLRLVIREHLRAESLTSHVEGDGDEVRLLLGQNVGQHREEAVHGIGVLAS